ncbi:hypothetical protein D3C78_1778260 [compost metagenome]
MVEVTPLLPRGSAALAPEFTVEADEVDHRGPGAQVHQPQMVLTLDQFSAEHLRVKRDALLQVLDA